MSLLYRYYLIEPKLTIKDKNISKYVGYTTSIEEYDLRFVKQGIKRNSANSKFIGTNFYKYLEYLDNGINDCVIIDLGVFEFATMYEVIDHLDKLVYEHDAKLNLKYPDIDDKTCWHNNLSRTCNKCRLECWHYTRKYDCPKCKNMSLRPKCDSLPIPTML